MTTIQRLALYLEDGLLKHAQEFTQDRLPAMHTVLLPESTPDRIAFSVCYRHPGGTLSRHTVKVRPSLVDGLSIKVTGKPEHDDTKRTIEQRFRACLERRFFKNPN